jgi:uncharacterized protein (UPF0333 family)
MEGIKSRKGQLSIEAGLVLLFLLLVLQQVWLGGPVQQSAEKSTDTNGVLLAADALDTIASAAEKVGMSGFGVREDFVIHVPFNTIEIVYSEGNYTLADKWGGVNRSGPHINMTLLVQAPLIDLESGDFGPLRVNLNGDPEWYGGFGFGRTIPFNTSYYYKRITKELKFPLDGYYFPLCYQPAKKNSTQIRGPNTRLVFIDDVNPADPLKKDIRFCCEAGFNLHLYAERSPANISKISLRSREYYSLPGKWKMHFS